VKKTDHVAKVASIFNDLNQVRIEENKMFRMHEIVRFTFSPEGVNDQLKQWFAESIKMITTVRRKPNRDKN